MKAITDNFYRWGWLVPSVLPLTQLGGRALFTVTVWLYFLWGCAVFVREKVELDRKILLLFLVLIVSYSLSIPFAEDSIRAFRKWAGYVAMASAFLFTWMVLEAKGLEAAQRLVRWVAILGLAMVAVAYGLLAVQIQSPGFTPTQQMREDSMPYLLPFILLFLYSAKTVYLRWGGIVLAITALMYYVFLSEGRAAQLAAVAAIFVSLLIVLRVRWYVAGITAAVVLALVAAGNWETFIQLSGDEQDLYKILNHVTSRRWEIWDHAIEHAPDWHFIGYGMGNLKFIKDVVTLSGGNQLMHLHNFILDAWYETGWLGLTALCLFVGSVLFSAVRVLQRFNHEERMLAGVALASVCAILVAGLFSFSYASKQFGVYLMLCLALLTWLSRQGTSADKG